MENNLHIYPYISWMNDYQIPFRSNGQFYKHKLTLTTKSWRKLLIHSQISTVQPSHNLLACDFLSMLELKLIHVSEKVLQDSIYFHPVLVKTASNLCQARIRVQPSTRQTI